MLQTLRLYLRPFAPEDAPIVQQLACNPAIAQGTLAIERQSDHALIGTVYLHLELSHARGELGYWIGKPYWGQGYATEAAIAIVRYGLRELNLNRIYAYHFTSNPASGRVMQKIGMKWEGRRRQHTLVQGVFVDSEGYAILRSEYE